MKKVYKFYQDCGRMGFLDGLFVADEKDVKALIGQNVYFGEVLGKHSDIVVTLTEKSFEDLGDNEDIIAFVLEHSPFGYNPLDFLDENQRTY